MRRRPIPPLERLEQRLSFFTPSDWFVATTLGVVMALAAGTLVAGVSLALTKEVPAHGGTYTEGVVGTPRFLNPLLAISDTDRDLSALIYSGLLKRSPDGSLAEDLASHYTVSEDKRTYTFTLKDNTRFHNGFPVTAEDVAFTVRQAQNPEIKSPLRANWQGVSVTVVDPRTIAFTLSTPYAPFLENATLGILPKALWQSVAAEEFPFSTLNTEPVGSGPYRVKSVRHNSSGIPTEYRLSAFTEGTRVPYITNMTFLFYSDAAALENAKNQGAVQGTYEVLPRAIIAPSTVHEAVFGRVFGIFFNQNQNNIFSELAVREALDAAVDKQVIVSTVLGGYGSPIDGPLPPTTTSGGALPERSREERIAFARATLEKAGWELGDDGIFQKTTTVNRQKKTERLSFTLSTSNAPELKTAAEVVADGWRGLGAEVATQFFDQNDLAVDVIQPRKYDALLFGLVVHRSLDLYPFWHSSQRSDPGLNVALYANVDVDTLLQAARTEHDTTVRREKAIKAANIIASETAAVFLYTPHFVYLSNPGVGGITLGTIETPSDRFILVEEWYLKTERVWPIFTTTFYESIKQFWTYL